MDNNYMDVVNKYKEQKSDKEKPIYNYSRDIHTGDINITPQRKKIIDNINDDNEILELSKSKVENNLNQVNDSLEKVLIEIKVHEKLLSLNSNMNEIYQSRLKTYLNELKYLKNKKIVLEEILRKLND